MQDLVYRALLSSVQLVAAPAAEQVASMPSFVDVHDDIVTDFDTSYDLVRQCVRSGRVDAVAHALLREIHEVLCAWPACADGLDEAAIAALPMWSRARELALAALTAMDEPRVPLPPYRAERGPAER